MLKPSCRSRYQFKSKHKTSIHPAKNTPCKQNQNVLILSFSRDCVSQTLNTWTTVVLLNILSVRKRSENRPSRYLYSDAANLGKPIFSASKNITVVLYKCNSKNKYFLMLRRKAKFRNSNTQFPVTYVTHIASYALLIMSTREFERR